MRDVDVTIAKPIDPVSQNDDRPSVLDLIKKHRDSIDEVKSHLETDPLYVPSKHDDLWILRFVLSHRAKTLCYAVKAAKDTLKFRHENRLDDKDIRDYPPQESESNEMSKYIKFCNNGCKWTIPDKRLGVIAFLRIGSLDFHSMANLLEKNEWLGAFIYGNEWTHQWLDFVTRTTGRLTKTVRFLDLGDISKENMSMEGIRLQGEYAKKIEDFFPQLLEKHVVCNYPAWIKTPWKVARRLFPKRMVAKFDFLDPVENSKDRAKLFKYLSEENILTHLGGPTTITFDEKH